MGNNPLTAVFIPISAKSANLAPLDETRCRRRQGGFVISVFQAAIVPCFPRESDLRFLTESTMSAEMNASALRMTSSTQVLNGVDRWVAVLIMPVPPRVREKIISDLDT